MTKEAVRKPARRRAERLPQVRTADAVIPSFCDNKNLMASGHRFLYARWRAATQICAGAPIETFIESSAGTLRRPLDNLFLPDGEFVVSSFNNNRVKHYDAGGTFLGDIAILVGPQGVEIGTDGQLYAGSFTDGEINRYDIDTLQFLGVAATTMGTSTTNNFTFDVVPEPCSSMLWGVVPLLALRRRRLHSLSRK